MRGETQKLGGWFNGPLNAKNVQATDSDIALAFQHKQEKSEFQQLSEQIAALAAGLTARDRQLSAISEQVRQGFKEQISHQIHYFKELETAIKGLTQIVKARFDTQGLRLAGLESKLEVVALGISNCFRQQSEVYQQVQALRAAAPKQKQRRKGKRK